LHCCARLPGSSDAALHRFNVCCSRSNVIPSLLLYELLLSSLLRDWQAAYASQLDVLRSAMVSHGIRLTPSMVRSLLPAFMEHEQAVARLQRWCMDDGVWNELEATERAMILQRGEACFAQLPITASPPAVTSDELSAAALEKLVLRLRNRRPVPSSSVVEATVSPFPVASWTVSALSNYLSIYTRLPGSSHALARFERIAKQPQVQ